MILKDGTKINTVHRIRKKGKPVAVFIHGDGQNHTVFKSLMDYFFHKGHSVLCYDLPGHGLSQPYKDKKYSFSRFVSTLKEILKSYDIKNPILIGNSSGGMIALQYATENKAASIIGISCCDEDPTRHNPRMNEIIEKYIHESKKAFQKQELFDYSRKGLSGKEIVSAVLKHTSPEAVEQWSKSLAEFDIRSRLCKIKSPVLLLGGSKDNFATKELMTTTKNEIPLARLVTFKGQGHDILLQIPEQMIKTIEKNYQFLVQE